MAYTKIVLATEILEPARRPLSGRPAGRVLPDAAARALRGPDPRAPAAPGDHRHGGGQPLRQRGRDQLLPPVVGRDRGRTTHVIRAHIAARAIFGAHDLDGRIRALDHQVDAAVQTALRMEVRTLAERATRWLVNNRHRPVDIGAAVGELPPACRLSRVPCPRC